MAVTPSNMLPLGTKLPEFALPDTDGRVVRASSFRGHPLVVVFMCNHCPFVKHILPALVATAREYQGRGVHFVGINSNDVEKYPEDSPAKMKELARRIGMTFPYLYDESQDTARAFKAACTPDLYLFDRDGRLVWRGRFDESTPGKGTATGSDLRAALDALLSGGQVPTDQHPSVGCNIKWK